MDLQKGSKDDWVKQQTEMWYSKVIPKDTPLDDDLHQKVELHYREAKRKDDKIFDEYDVKFGTPLSAEEHSFHNVSRNRDYDVQRKLHEQEGSQNKQMG